MTKRIFRSICLAALTVLLACIVIIMGMLYGYFSDIQQAQLRMQTGLAAQGISHEGMGYLEGLKVKEYRITWIGGDGTVIYDSTSDAAGMENHLEREEVAQALSEGYGESRRYSYTLAEGYFYCAQLLPDGTVLRLSIAQRSILKLVLNMVQPFSMVFAIAVILSIFLAVRIAKRIVRPLNEIDLDRPLANDGYEELSPLLRRIDSQQGQLRRQEEALRQKQNELDTVIGSMNEGMILLNRKRKILSINPAARRLLGAGADCTGADMLTVSRNLDVQGLLEQAFRGKPARQTIELQGGRYQIDVNPVAQTDINSAAQTDADSAAQAGGSPVAQADEASLAQNDTDVLAQAGAPGASGRAIPKDAISGAAVIFFNVTERERAEQMRREFTANVSHELKTPLHSISGYAELMKNDMVKSADIIPFAGRIYGEAQRMIQLVEDIISLSHLDEGAGGMQRERVELCELAKKAISSLEPEAREASVSLEVTGWQVYVEGVGQLLYSIVYNLCDNAIKYNRKDGRVSVSVAREGASAVLTVRDTGIGIAPEHQERIFERFYRVDKSRSKAVGGTGLGLSIVKHAVKIHHGSIAVDSRAGEGTEITVRLPVS